MTNQPKTSTASPYFVRLVDNLHDYLETKDMSLREFSDKTDIPFETLRSIIYRKTNTCRLDTAVAIARQLGMTLDEVVGSGLVPQELTDEMKIVRTFSNTEKELLHWYIRKIDRRHQKYPGKKFVTVMSPICFDSSLKTTNDYTALNVTGFPQHVIQTAFFGIEIPCEHYMPHYCRGNILLIASDRKPRLSEHCLVNVGDNLYIAVYHEENGKPKLKSIINKRPFTFDITLNDVVGYVCHVLEE